LYAERAGESAFWLGACRDAIPFLERARAFRAREPVREPVELARVEEQLAEAYWQVGPVARALEVGMQALAHYGCPLPRTWLGWVAGTLGEAAVRVAQRVWSAPFAEREPIGRARRQALVRLMGTLVESCCFRQHRLKALWSHLRLLNLGEPLGPSALLARTYAVLAVAVGAGALHRLGWAWARKAIELVERVGDDVDRAFVYSRAASCFSVGARWEVLQPLLDRCEALLEKVQVDRVLDESRFILAATALIRGQLTRALHLWERAEASARRKSFVLLRRWGQHLHALSLVRLGRPVEAVAGLRASAEAVAADNSGIESLVFHGVLALGLLRSGKPEQAHAHARKALAELALRPALERYSTFGLVATAEVLVRLADELPFASNAERAQVLREAREACGHMWRCARLFTFLEPAAWWCQGRLESLPGYSFEAHRSFWRARAAAARLGLPLEEARAALELARLLPPGNPHRRELLDQARALIDGLGAADGLREVEADLRREGLAHGEAEPASF
ncbi:MAG TPA: hypothetical protein VK420_07190, partial [Longimicrobium sp.]|nr:hypothetical protein [Longimicrobium sp.]